MDKATSASLATRVLNKAVVDATSSQFTGLHLFVGADGKGFAPIAADDRVRPVLAYSPDGTFDPATMPEHVAGWINGYQQEIASVGEAGGTPSPKVAQEWERWNQGTVRSGTTWVDPLMTSHWAQNPIYNYYCPYDTVLWARSVFGCVATAMAQIMRYWQWPEVGYSSHSYEWSYYGTLSVDFENTYYNWEHMPDSLLVFSTADSESENDDFAFISNGNLIINGTGTLQVFDILGHELFRKELPTANSQLPTVAGVYVLRLINGNDVKTQKIVVE